MEVFVLAIILMVTGQDDMVLPLIAYTSKDVCEEKIAVLEKDLVYKNPALGLDCYPMDKFKKEEQQKEEEKKQ